MVTIPQSTVQVGSTELVEIVYSLSPSEFYVQISSDSDKLTTLMSDIAAAFETGQSKQSNICFNIYITFINKCIPTATAKIKQHYVLESKMAFSKALKS